MGYYPTTNLGLLELVWLVPESKHRKGCQRSQFCLWISELQDSVRVLDWKQRSSLPAGQSGLKNPHVYAQSTSPNQFQDETSVQRGWIILRSHPVFIQRLVGWTHQQTKDFSYSGLQGCKHSVNCRGDRIPRTLNRPTCLQPFAWLERLLVLLQKMEPLNCRTFWNQ